MYQLLLTNRYLTSRIIPLLAVAAVALCVALVIVVVSVMTGFLEQFRTAGRTLIGDAVVTYSFHGIPYYEKLIDQINASPESAAATPVVDTWGVLRMPYDETVAVQIWGIDPERFNAVTGYEDTLYWKDVPGSAQKHLFSNATDLAAPGIVPTLQPEQKIELITEWNQGNEEHSPEELASTALNLNDDFWILCIDELAWRSPESLRTIFNDQQWALIQAEDSRIDNGEDVLRDGMTMTRNGRPAIVAGMHVSKGNVRTMEGAYAVQGNGRWWLPHFQGTLTTIPIDRGGGMSDPESIVMPFANEFLSKVRPIDKQRIFIPLSTAQELTHLDAAPLVDENDPTRIVGMDPARATMILVRAADGVTPAELVVALEQAYDSFLVNMASEESGHVPIPNPLEVSIQTWEELQADFIGPVEKERELMRILFSIIYLVCAALVLAIMWSIVHEKTRDIGILRSVGATRGGIVGIFLLYGLVIGILGGVLGFFLGWLITFYIDDIHTMLGNPPMWLGILLLAAAVSILIWAIVHFWTGRLLPTVLGTFVSIPLLLLGVVIVWASASGQGFVMWNADVYYFPQVPNRVDLMTAFITMIGGIIFSVLGAFIPAAKAADTDPINALRYE